MGNVSLFISGSNIPGAAGNATQQLASGVSTRRRSRAAYRRGLFSDIVNSKYSLVFELSINTHLLLLLLKAYLMPRIKFLVP